MTKIANKQLDKRIKEEKLNQRQKSFALQTLLLNGKSKSKLNHTKRRDELNNTLNSSKHNTLNPNLQLTESQYPNYLQFGLKSKI